MAEVMFHLWSNKHSAWWRADANGYTKDRDAAGVYSHGQAIHHVVQSSYCGQVSGVTCMVAAPAIRDLS